MDSVAEDERSGADAGDQQDCTVFLLDQDGRVASWDPRAERIKGYRAEEILGKHFSIFYPPEERASGADQQSLRRALATDRYFAEGWRIRKDGSRFFARVVISPVRDEAGVLRGFSKITRVATPHVATPQVATPQVATPQVATPQVATSLDDGVSDSSDLAVLEEKGRTTDLEAEPHLIRNALLLANVQDAVVVTDLAGRVTYWNDGATRLFGWTAEEMLGCPLAKRFPESMRGEVAEQTEMLAEGGEWEGEFHDCHKDGSRIWIDARVRRMTSEAGDAIGFISISRDINERKEAQESLRREKELIAAVIENLPGIFYLFDLHGIYRRWNGNALRITGSTPQDLIDRDPLEFICPEDRERAGATMREIVESGEATLEADMLAGDGTRVPYLFTGKRVVIDGVPCITGMGIDFSERKKLEEQVRQAHKMEAVGRLAGGIAHDFNNLLTVINGFSDLLRDILEGHEEAVPLVEEVLQAGEQAAKLTGQLLAFSRKEMHQPRVFDLNALIRDFGETIPKWIGDQIELTLRLAPELARVEGDASQLKQALTNLVVNAQPAMTWKLECDGGSASAR